MAIAALPLLSWSTTVRAPDFDRLVNTADYIVRAKVTSINAERSDQGVHRKIYSKVQLEIQEIVVGNPPATVILQLLGGRVGDDELWIEGAPRFAAGEEGFFFVRGNGRQMFPLVALMYGYYPVERSSSGREYVARSNHAPLRSTLEVAQPLEPDHQEEPTLRLDSAATGMSAAEFSSQIRAARRTKS